MKTFNFEKEYESACNTPSDINEHIPTLLKIAQSVDSITEMGVRSGVSTRAFMYANPKKLIAYDLKKDHKVDQMFEYAKTLGKNFHYIESNVLDIKIEKTDLLFIDTFHCYEQLSQELQLHAKQVKKYVIFHDVYTYGLVPEKCSNYNFVGTKGILYAIEEFLENNHDWEKIYHVENNNGLMIIEKK